MELVKKNIHFNRIAKEVGNQITLEEDINIPDTKEDIEDILFHNYRVVIEEAKTGDQKVHIRGKMMYCILYRSEETGKLCSTEGGIPIDEQLYMEGIGSSDKVIVKTRVEDFSVGIINSRKISIQSILELYAYVQEVYDEQITTGVNDAECETYTKECDFTQLAVCKKDIIRFRENVTIPNNMPNVENVVFDSIRVQDMEYKPQNEQLAIQGKMQVFIIYDGERDSHNQVYQTVLPFSTVVECSGSNMNMVSAINYEIVDSQVYPEADFDGEVRSFAIELVLELDMKLFEQQKVDVLCDVYGIRKDLNPNVRMFSYNVLNSQYSGNMKVSDKMHLPRADNGQIKVLHADGKSVSGKCEITSKGIVLNGMVVCQVLYETGMEGTEYGNSQFMIPFTKTLEPKSDAVRENLVCNINMNCEELQFSFDMDGSMEIKANVAYEILIFEETQGRNIVDVDVKEMDMEKCNNLPSMAVCFANRGDTLWEMGKKYCVPIRQIKEMNNLMGDEIKEGEKVLIVRGMCS